MTINKVESFNKKGEALFRPILERYRFILKEKKINELNGQQWSAHHIYVNTKANLKIIVKQEPYYTDYGFSFSIHRLDTNEYNILCNVPHEKQDSEDQFLEKACDEIFSSPELVDLISGKLWKQLKRIPLQT